MKTFVLSDKDKVVLKKWGYRDEDFQQIESAVNHPGSVFETNKDNHVSWLTAKRMLGCQEFLSGISRASFHWTAMRDNDRNHCSVYMDFSEFFK